MAHEDCYFCGKRFLLNREIELSQEQSLLYENAHVFVTPDIAPLVCGHLLIVSKAHWNSFGNVPEEVAESLEQMKKFLKEKVFCGEEILFFEHGAVLEGTAGSSIDHAHIHVFPIKETGWFEQCLVKSPYVKGNKLRRTREQLYKLAQQRQPYLYYELPDGEEWVYPVGKLPSQFLRKIVASHYGRKHNWKEIFSSEESRLRYRDTLERYYGQNEFI